MEMDSDFYKTICRVCLCSSNNESMVSLVDISSRHELSCYGKALKIFADILLTNDYLPNSMCQSCLSLLKQAIILKKTSENSQKVLQKLVDKNSGEKLQIKEKVTEYVMFNSYFPDELDDHNCNNVKKTITTKEYNWFLTPQHVIMEEEKSSTVDNELVFENDYKDNQFQDYQSYESDEDNENLKEMKEKSVDNLLNGIEKVIKSEFKLQNINPRNYDYNRPNSIDIKIEGRNNSHIKKENKPTNQQRNITCKVCNKTLANIATYNCHMQRHTGCRYVCELCAKGFPVYALLQSHQAAVHGFGRFFICKQCGYKASRKFELVEHERVHTGERPFACDKCGLTFRRRFIWMKHALYHKEKTVQCPKCPRKFYQRGEMLAHSNNVHERVRVYSCSECNVTYAKTSTVRRHLTEKHGIPREKQGKIAKIKLGKSSIDKE